MVERASCPHCGASLTPGSLPDDLCPSCLLELGIESPIGDKDEEAPTLGWGSESTPSDGLRQIGPYELVRKLGEGGMGEVYLAIQHEPIHRHVALKVIKLGMDSSEVISRFETERQALALMNHPGIAGVLDAGTTDEGQPFFVMEYVPGVPITEYSDRERLTAQERLELFLQVCHAIHHAHQRGIIHRDIKPANILVSFDDGEHRPKVIDFGIAKAIDRKLTAKTLFTQLGSLVGTPEYMSPEQAAIGSKDIDITADVYSLGVLLYELLTGTLPHPIAELRDAGFAEILRVIQEEEPLKPSTRVGALGAAGDDVAGRRSTGIHHLRREIEGDLDWVTLKALAKDRQHRYQSATELAGDIERHLRHETVSAGPPDLSYRARKFVRRHKVGVAATCTVFLIAVAAAIVSTTQYLRAEAARRTTRRQFVDLQVDRGMELVENGDLLGSLPWLVRALELEEDTRMVDEHRFRIGTVLDQSPHLVQLWSHGSGVHSVSFNTDGNLVLSIGSDDSARLWSVDSKDTPFAMLPHEAPLTCGEFSADGRWVATADESGEVRMWESSSGRSATEPLKHMGPVAALAFSADSRRLATGSVDGTARVWEVPSGRAISELQHRGQITVVAFAPGGDKVLSATDEGQIHWWHAESGADIMAPIELSVAVSDLDISADGASAVVVDVGGRARVWELPSATPGSPWIRFDLPLTSVTFTSDSDRMVVTGLDGTARVLNVSSGSLVTQPLLHGSGAVIAAELHGDDTLVTAGEQSVSLWALSEGGLRTQMIRHSARVSDADMDASGRFLAASTEPGSIYLWDLAGPADTAPAFRLASFDLVAARGIPRARAVLTLSNDPPPLGRGGFAQLRDLDSGEPIVPPMRHEQYIDYHPVVTPGGDRIVTGGGDRVVRVWNATSGELALPPLVHEQQICALALHPEGIELAVGLGDCVQGAKKWQVPGGISLWDLETGTSVGQLIRGSTVAYLEYSVDGRRLLSVDNAGAATVLDRASGRESEIPIATPRYNLDVSRLFSPAGDRVGLPRLGGGAVQIFDSADGRPAGPPIGHSRPDLLWFSPNHQEVLLFEVDAGGQLWDLDSGQPAGPFLSHEGQGGADLSPNGDWVVTASAEGLTRIWNAHTGALIGLFRFPSTAYGVSFLSDKRAVLTGHLDGTGKVSRLRRDDRSLNLLRHLSQVLSGYRLASGTEPEALTAKELSTSWRELQDLAGGRLALPAQKVLSWHRSQATESASHRDWREALRHLDRYLELEPGVATMRDSRGRARAEVGNWQGARSDFATAVDLRSGFPDLAHHLALAELSLENVATARAICTELLEEHGQTTNPDRAYWVSRTCSLTAGGVPAGDGVGIELAEKAMPLTGSEAEILGLLGAALYRAGRYEEAEAPLQESVDSKDQVSTTWSWAFLAMTRFRLSRVDAAKKALQQAERSAAETSTKDSIDESLSWSAQHEASVLLAEVRSLLGVRSKTTARSPS